MNKSSRVIVIGGGVIGTSVAYFAARAGHQVSLFERGDIAAGTSGACDGFIIMQSKTPGPHLDLALESASIYKSLEEELEHDIEYKPCGGLVVAENEKQAELLKQHIAKQRISGLQVDLLPIEEAARREPALARDLWGGAFCEHDAQANPMKLAQGFAQAARRFGADIRCGVSVDRLMVERGKVIGVHTSTGSFQADAVVNAAGVWAPELLKPFGVDIPIKPRRGQLLVTESIPPTINHVILCACYLIAKYHPEELDPSDRHHRLGVGLAVEQTVHGGLLIGSTREFAGFDRRTTLAGIEAVAKHAQRILPIMAKINIIRSFAGLRPYTPNGLPIIGALPELPGLIMAAGHEGDGIALTPVTGKRIAAILSGI